MVKRKGTRKKAALTALPGGSSPRRTAVASDLEEGGGIVGVLNRKGVEVLAKEKRVGLGARWLTET